MNDFPFPLNLKDSSLQTHNAVLSSAKKHYIHKSGTLYTVGELSAFIHEQPDIEKTFVVSYTHSRELASRNTRSEVIYVNHMRKHASIMLRAFLLGQTQEDYNFTCVIYIVPTRYIRPYLADSDY